MSDSPTTSPLIAARQSLAQPLSFDDVLAKLGSRDRVNAQRRITVLDGLGYPEQARVWQRLACSLMTLAPIAKFVGTQAVEFFVPDGRYRMQVLALEDLKDGNITVYCPDALSEATSAGLLVPTGRPEPYGFAVAESGEPLHIDTLDGSALNPDAHFKNLTNWNRKALRITLPPSRSIRQVEAAELLCAIAARQFAPAASPGNAPAE